jgi:hypothetical protein
LIDSALYRIYAGNTVCQRTNQSIKWSVAHLPALADECLGVGWS